MGRIHTDSIQALPGRTAPFGATVHEDGVNFALFSRHATKVHLVLFEPDSEEPATEFTLEPDTYRFGDVWSVLLKGLVPGAWYMYRVEGPNEPKKGLLFDSKRLLLDPYARAIAGNVSEGTERGVVTAPLEPLAQSQLYTPWKHSFIYEVHVKGLTAHPTSEVKTPGTYSAVKEKIPHLKELGVTAVELLPVHHCGERRIDDRKNPDTGEPLINFWGYQPIGYFAPDNFYASGGNGEQVAEFRDMVAALHDAGIEVFVDVVFNHTSEGGIDEPATSFRGIDNPVYYHVDGQGRYRDYTGCGNAVNCNHPVVRDFIIEALRYWVTELHVDGFRFDLACVLNRDRNGNLHFNSAIVDRIAEDPVLQRAKIIAEAWDLGGGYQVGGFGGSRWAEWNGRYRDDVRRFWRGDRGMKGDFALRITGSPDLYQNHGRSLQNSINFITAHDGFTLADLVSYNKKHNEANGEDNRDGSDDNNSWNCGAEGPSDDPIVTAMRARMQRNHLTTLFLSLGVPMLLGGDEFGRTQQGNNNAYCQDNELSWFDWTLVETNRDLLRYTKALVEFRNSNPVFQRTSYFTGQPSVKGGQADLLWFDSAGLTQDWGSSDLTLACRMDGADNDGVSLYFMFNPSGETLDFRVPDGHWRVQFDTSKSPPRDCPEPDNAPRYNSGQLVRLGQKTMVVLAAEPAGSKT